MKTIGIIGKAGVGKSTIINEMVRNVDNCQAIIVDIFVAKLFKYDSFYQYLVSYLCGTLDKDIVRNILFNDIYKMSLIEKYVEKELLTWIGYETRFEPEYIFIESANLHKFNKIKVDYFIEITCNEELRIKRLIERNGSVKAGELIEFQKDLVYNMDNKYILSNDSNLLLTEESYPDLVNVSEILENIDIYIKENSLKTK